ncbi:MASE1 domain-containing protein [Caulobacter sp. DWR1-3-2b1]|uniref:MASE1 domain-containing protein n=1 Tax=Caulobacter sp. DWR1-3-2b1 TaxID=2804670 RepID=UPI003CEDD04D
MRLERQDIARTALASLIAGLGFALLAYVCVEIPRAYNQVTPIWLSNGFVVACLLAVDTRRWSWILSASLVGGLLAGAHAGDSVLVNFVLTPGNILQIWLCAWSTRRVLGREIDLGRPKHIVALVGLAGFAAPLVTGVVSSLFHTAIRGGDPWANMTVWVLGDILGVLTVTPCLLVLVKAKTYLAERGPTRDGLLSLLGLLVVTTAVFGQNRYPLMFLVPPMMLLVASRQEVLGGVVGAALVATIVLLFTMAGRGPIHLIEGSATEQSIVLQTFLAVSIFVSLPVAAFQRQRRYILAQMAQASESAARSEARYRLLTENALDVIVHSDLKGRVTYISPSVFAVLGYAAEELTGERPVEFVHPDYVAAVVAISQAQVSGQGDHFHDRVEYLAYRKDRSLIWLESRPTLALDPVSGEKVGLTDVVRDITARKVLEQELREARATAEAAAAAKGEFLANMSHELRTPLTAVIGFANLVDNQPELAADTRRHVGRIVDGGRSLLATINDILDFSKLDAGHMEIRPRHVNVADLVRDVLDMFTLQAAAKGLTLNSQGLDCLPSNLWLDPERVRQVLLNLIGNAVKFTETGGVTVGLTYDTAGERLGVAVIDTGQGIAEEDRTLLFMRFSQVDATIRRQHGGTGLGLAISKSLVEAMGGEIGVESQAGQGARFFFDLYAPIRALDVAEDQAPPPSLPTGCRVLVVDDNAANRELVRTVLEAFDAHVSEAVDGEEGVIAAEAEQFDIILMDLRMPRLDGVQAAQRIRAGQGPSAGAPIVAFSADVSSGSPGAVFNGSVSKPMTVESLIGAISKLLPA